MNDRAVRMPRLWAGLVAALVGAWWATHDETMKYVLGLLLLAGGLVALGSALLRRLHVLKRVALIAGLGVAVLAAGIVSPIVRADSQTSSVWTAGVQGRSWFATDDAVLVAGLTDGDEQPAMVALDRDTGKVTSIGRLADGVQSRRFTSDGDLVQVSETPGTVRVDYVTVESGELWTREFPEKQRTSVDVIAGARGFAAVRTCRPDRLDLLTSCVVSTIGPDGAIAWSRRLDAVAGFERPKDRLIPEVLGTVPGDVLRLRVLNLEDGSIARLEFGDDPDIAEKYLPRDFLTASAEHGLPLRGEGLQVEVVDDDVILGHAGEREWKRRIPGATWISYANGGVAVESKPTGWSPFLPWRTSAATKITMLDVKTGAVTATAVVPYVPVVYPVSSRAAIVTGGRGGSHGMDEQRLVGRR
ncbi:hypothetical protein ASC61_00355 [Aeromicrobium sp. Root344]|uniref:hypothetical protein n=1 Tax=Aeromicrobium sp. Root344 TaxID=1736521 RepID=UPI000701A261|nr:hypothetical protein [Aeromicrobium sp. Root344]KQV73592.1 hypothetical protein ASC61_00355 [Aeromicrobium sp. Root344]